MKNWWWHPLPIIFINTCSLPAYTTNACPYIYIYIYQFSCVYLWIYKKFLQQKFEKNKADDNKLLISMFLCISSPKFPVLFLERDTIQQHRSRSLQIWFKQLDTIKNRLLNEKIKHNFVQWSTKKIY